MRRLRLGSVASLAAVLFLLGAPVALAQSGSGVTEDTPAQSANKLQIAKINSTDLAKVQVQFTYNGEPKDLERVTLRENGQQITTSRPQTLKSTGTARATVLVVDLSGSMQEHGGLDTAKRKMRELIEAKDADDQMAIVGFGWTSNVYQKLTADKGDLLGALDKLNADAKAHTAMWDGVANATAMLAGEPKLQHNIILVADGSDDASQTTVAQVRGDLVTTATQLFAMGITQEGQLDRSGIRSLVSAAGGRFFVAEKATDIAAAFDQTATALGNQFVVTYKSLAGRGRASLDLTVGGTTVAASFTTGGIASGSENLKPQIVAAPGGPAFLRNSGGLVLGLVLLGLAVAIAAYVVTQLVVAKRSGLSAMLSPYSDGYGPTGSDDADGGSGGGLGQSAFLQRAVNMTEGFAQKQGFLEELEARLERADIPLRAAEVLFFYLVALLVAVVVGFLLAGLIGALVLLIIGGVAGPAILSFRERQRKNKFTAQLPDMLQLMAGALRAGFSLMQAVDAVSQEVEDPMGKELRRVVTEARLGRELEESLEDTAERTASDDFAWAVMAIRIQREVGGNLAELLLTVAETMVQRTRLRREVKALTAEGRISAIVLGVLPPGLGAFITLTNPDFMRPLFHEFLGQMMLGLAIVSMIIGFVWMNKVIQIEI